MSVEQACFLCQYPKAQEEKEVSQQIISLSHNYDETFVEKTP